MFSFNVFKKESWIFFIFMLVRLKEKEKYFVVGMKKWCK